MLTYSFSIVPFRKFVSSTRILLLFVFVCLVVNISHAAEISITWNSVAAADGYNIYYGHNSRSYDFVIDVGQSLQYTADDLDQDTVYYFAVTAYNEWGESAFSEEISTAEYCLGNTHVFSNRTRIGNRRAVPYTMPEDGTLTSITMYHEAGYGKMLLGVYADDGKGSPGSRLAVTAESEVSRIEGWQTLELIQPVFAAAGSRIWLGWVYENNPGLRYREGSPARAESDELWDEGMPTTWGPSSLENYIYSIYASYLPRIGVYPLDNDYDNDCDIDGSDLANGGFQDLEDLASNYGLIGCSFDEMNQNK
jgi:hypothetical protein